MLQKSEGFSAWVSKITSGDPAGTEARPAKAIDPRPVPRPNCRAGLCAGQVGTRKYA